MTGSDHSAEPPARFYVEAHPGGGWTVRMRGHVAPVSRHDTEEEAHAKAAAYQRGVDPGPAAPAHSGGSGGDL